MLQELLTKGKWYFDTILTEISNLNIDRKTLIIYGLIAFFIISRLARALRRTLRTLFWPLIRIATFMFGKMY